MSNSDRKKLQGQTAQQAFHELMRDHVGPKLREMGFKGSGSKFRRLTAEYGIELWFQRSKFSNRDAVFFDVNLTILDVPMNELSRQRNADARVLGRRTETWPSGLHWNRLSRLVPGRKDFDWRIAHGESPELIAEDVIECLRNIAIPEIGKELKKGSSDSGGECESGSSGA